MKNKKLAVLLAILSLNFRSDGLKLKNVAKVAVNNVVYLGLIYLYLKNGKLKEENSKLRNIYDKKSGNLEAKEAMNEILSRVDKYKNLNYNERVKGFLEEARKIINDCDAFDKGEETDIERDKIDEYDRSWEKTEKEISHTSFKLIKNKDNMVCQDYTYVFGKMAKKLGIRCYPLSMIEYNDEKSRTNTNKKLKGHSVLLFAKEKTDESGKLKKDWYILDGRNYSSFKKENLSNDEGLFKLEDLQKLQKGLGDEWIKGQIYIKNNMHSSFLYPKFKKILTEEDLQKMRDGQDLYFNKTTLKWDFRILTPRGLR